MNLLIIRLIIFGVLLYAGLKLYRMYREWAQEREEDQARRRLDDGRMVRCAYCHVHLPEDDALRERGEWFCCLDHKERYLEEQRPGD